MINTIGSGTLNYVSAGPVFFYFIFLIITFYSTAQLVGGFTLSDLLDKPWSQVSSLLPPGTCLHFYRA